MRSPWGFGVDAVMDWRVDAACSRSGDPDAWLTSPGKLTARNKTAMRICGTCPVLQACRSWYDSLPALMRQSVIAGGVRYDVDGRPQEPRRVHTGPPRGVLSTGQAAAHLQVSGVTVKNWCKSGKLPAVRDGSGHWRIRAEDLPEVEHV